MGDSVLSGILKIDKETKKSFLSIDATLQKIYKIETDKNKREIRQRKDDLQREKTKEKEKNILEDILGELKKKKKGEDKEKDKKKSFWDTILSAAGPAITGFFGRIFGAAGPIFGVVASAISGWKLGEWLNKNIIDPWKSQFQKFDNKVKDTVDKIQGGGNYNGVSSKRAAELIKEKRAQIMGNPMWGVPSLTGAAKEQQEKDVEALTNIVFAIRERQKINDLLYDAKQKNDQSKIEKLTKELKEKEDKITELVDSRPALNQELGVQKRQTGGPITVPGTGSGDKVPMMLPPGSFVLNRNASAMLQNGGLVPTLLEPGEKVFGPNDVSPMHHMLNSMIPRFQEGGEVTRRDTSKEKTSNKGTSAILQGAGLPAVISTGKSLIKQGFTVAEHPNFHKGPPSKYDPDGKARVGRHSSGSLHYAGLALDVTDWRGGDWKGRTRQLAEDVYKQRDTLKLTQIIHDPWGAWFKGESKPGPGIGGHGEHLHLGFGKGKGGVMNDSLNGDIASSEEPKQQSGFDKFMSSVSGLGEVGKAISGVFGTFANIAGGPLMNAIFGMGPATATQSNQPTTGSDPGQSYGSAGVGGPFDKTLAKLLKNYEGLRTNAYKDAVGIPTIGIGATYYPKGFRLSGRVKMGQTITESEAEFIKAQHVKEHRARLLREISASEYSKVPDNVKAALESKVFNYGSLGGPLADLTKRGIKDKNYAPVSSYFKNTLAKHNGGLNSWRRNDEANIIDTGHSKRAGVAFSKNATALQTGGIVNMSGSQSPNASRFKKAQEDFAQMIADKSSAPVVIVGGGGGGSGPTVIPTPNMQATVPNLPDGPNSLQAAEYFYNLSLSSVL